MEKKQEPVRIDLTEAQKPEQDDESQTKLASKDLEVSELESRIAPTQVGTFF